MPELMFAVPVLPGMEEENRRFTRQLVGERKAEHQASRKRLGWTMEQVWHQKSPDQTFSITRHRLDDPEKTMADLAASKDPFDVFFKERILEIHGMDLNQPLPGLPKKVLQAGTSSTNPDPSTMAVGMFPFLKGKTDKALALAKEIDGPRRKEYEAAALDAGLTSEEWWIQKTPEMDIGLNYWEGKNPKKAIEHQIKKPTPIDQYILDEFKDISGLDLQTIELVWPVNILDWRA